MTALYNSQSFGKIDRYSAGRSKIYKSCYRLKGKKNYHNKNRHSEDVKKLFIWGKAI